MNIQITLIKRLVSAVSNVSATPPRYTDVMQFANRRQETLMRKEQQMKTLGTKIALGIATLTLVATGLGFSPTGEAMVRKVNEYEGQHIVRKVNEYEGQHLAKKGSFDITEVEGQTIALAGDPSQWG